MNDRKISIVVIGLFTIWGFIAGVGTTLIFEAVTR